MNFLWYVIYLSYSHTDLSKGTRGAMKWAVFPLMLS